MDLPTSYRPRSGWEMQTSPMAMQSAREKMSMLEWQTAKDWASAWESAKGE